MQFSSQGWNHYSILEIELFQSMQQVLAWQMWKKCSLFSIDNEVILFMVIILMAIWTKGKHMALLAINDARMKYCALFLYSRRFLTAEN